MGLNANPKYSFIATAIRDYYYEDAYNNIAKNNKTDFEVIFVGDKKPLKSMPDNFRYIETSVKPAQCLEIAARNAKGDFLMETADDVRYEEGCLERIEYYTNSLDMEKIFISFRYMKKFKIIPNLSFNGSDQSSTPIGLGGVFRRDLWNSLGGLDNRFVTSLYDIDMQMRFFEYGMKLFVPNDCIMREIKPHKTELKLFRKGNITSKTLLHSLWKNPDDTMSKKRLYPVQSFEDKDILLRSQGARKGIGKNGKFKWI